MKIRILLPTYNECASIEPMIRGVFKVMPDAHVLVIDDSSPDGTAGIVQRLTPEFPNLKLMVRPNKDGLGNAYLAGIAESLDSFDALVTMDADCSHDPMFLPAMAQAAETRDLVIGSRYAPGGGIEAWEFWRRVLSAGGNLYSRTITGLPVHDVTSGFQLVRTEALQRIDRSKIAASGYAFLIELKYRLWKSGARLTEVPIVFRARRGGESKLSGHIVREGVTTPWRLKLLRL